MGPHFHDLSSYSSYHKSCVCTELSQDIILRASRVLSLGDGLLGSPVPRVLVAITLNSYSVQGSKSTTVAFSLSPSTSAGAAKKCTDFILQCQNFRAIALKHYTILTKNILKTTTKFHFWNPFLYFKSMRHGLIILQPSLRDINHHVGLQYRYVA